MSPRSELPSKSSVSVDVHQTDVERGAATGPVACHASGTAPHGLSHARQPLAERRPIVQQERTHLMASKYLIVVFTAEPSLTERSVQSSSYPSNRKPSVHWVTASNPTAALKQVRVEPGGHALLVNEPDVNRYDRAKEAPLEARQPDGTPLPQVAAA